MMDLKREIKFPQDSEKLAEFIGILFGDGCVNIYKVKGKLQYSYISIVGHSVLDKDYLNNYVSSLVSNLFNMIPIIRIRKNQQVMELRILSKGITNFLITKGIKLGPKNDLSIPDWIKNKKEFTKSFIRGLTDTDGSIALKKRYRNTKYYPTIKIGLKNKDLIVEIHKFLQSLNLKSNLFVDIKKTLNLKEFKFNTVELNGYDNLVLWMKEIGFSNPKHLNKIPIIQEQRKTLKRNYKLADITNGAVTQPGRVHD